MPFQKGQSGNPKGAPKKEQTFSKALEKAIDEMEVEIKNKDSVEKVKGKDCVARAYMDLAFNTKYPPQIRLHALDTIVERVDGKARQTVSVDGDVNTNSQSVFDILKLKNMPKEKRELLEQAFSEE